MSKKYCVYVHILKYSPYFAYVGTTKNLKTRFNNGHGYYGQVKFQRAIDCYGWDNFKHIVLKENLTEAEAHNEEKRYIELYDSIDNGFNVDSGGKFTNLGAVNRYSD
jgi:hypothetical protein